MHSEEVSFSQGVEVASHALKQVIGQFRPTVKLKRSNQQESEESVTPVKLVRDRKLTRAFLRCPTQLGAQD